MLALVTLSTTIYASFPVTSNGPATDSVVLQDIQLTTEAPPAEFHFGGFILGLLLGLIGVGLAYIFSSDPDFRRNAWYGLGTWMIIWLLLMSAV
tara:strand:- start:28 stop:309 length:282 start_codon:yes stop_codon:yes gene_type:complete